MKKLGDCYEVHGEAIALNDESGLLCHGTVWHSKSGWHGHAWIERGEVVCDYSNGSINVLSKELYYALGYIKDVKRYSADEARRMMLKTRHFGAW